MKNRMRSRVTYGAACASKSGRPYPRYMTVYCGKPLSLADIQEAAFPAAQAFVSAPSRRQAAALLKPYLRAEDSRQMKLFDGGGASP